MASSGSDTRSSQNNKQRYGTYNFSGSDGAEIAVRVTSADFNGSTFDGSPFSVVPSWLAVAINEKTVAVSTEHGDRDYAVWAVQTSRGLRLAFPGDYILIREDKSLSVVSDADGYILINLRPPNGFIPHNVQAVLEAATRLATQVRDVVGLLGTAELSGADERRMETLNVALALYDRAIQDLYGSRSGETVCKDR